MSRADAELTNRHHAEGVNRALNNNPAMQALKHHISGAIERGEAEPVTEQRETVDVTPNWESMRAFVRNVARTDPARARRINAALACEGVPASELKGN